MDCQIFLMLTLYHTIPTFNDPEEEAWKKTVWEKEKMLFSTLSGREVIILATFDFLSANALKLVKSRYLPFGTGVKDPRYYLPRKM